MKETYKIRIEKAQKEISDQGNYSYLQCAKGCHDKEYYNESLRIGYMNDLTHAILHCTKY